MSDKDWVMEDYEPSYLCKEAMTKTKDEMMEDWLIDYLDNGNVCRNTNEQLQVNAAFRYAASRMYDARQKEIDEANRWWATRWQSSHDWWNGPNGLEPSRDEYNLSDGQLKATREMDAAAKKVMEVK